MTTVRINIVFFLVVLISVFGCASQQPLIKKTASGYPEGIFKNTTKEAVISKIIDRCSRAGSMVSVTEATQVICAKELSDGDAMLAKSFLVGGAYSTTPVRKARFLVYKIDGLVKVVVHEWIESQSPLGQVDKFNLKSNKDINAIQKVLFAIGAE